MHHINLQRPHQQCCNHTARYPHPHAVHVPKCSQRLFGSSLSAPLGAVTLHPLPHKLLMLCNLARQNCYDSLLTLADKASFLMALVKRPCLIIVQLGFISAAECAAMNTIPHKA